MRKKTKSSNITAVMDAPAMQRVVLLPLNPERYNFEYQLPKRDGDGELVQRKPEKTVFLPEREIDRVSLEEKVMEMIVEYTHPMEFYKNGNYRLFEIEENRFLNLTELVPRVCGYLVENYTDVDTSLPASVDASVVDFTELYICSVARTMYK